MRRVIAIVLLTVALAGCTSKQTDLPQRTVFPTGGPSLSGYLCIFDNAVDFLQFSVNNGVLTGTEQEVLQPPGSLQTENIDRPISGTVNGSQITITLGNYAESGTFDGSKLELAVHQQDGSLFNAVYNPATTDDYNNAVATFEANLQATATAINNAEVSATAIATSNNNLTNDFNAIQTDIDHLTTDRQILSDMSSYQQDISALQDDYSQEQSDQPQGCVQITLDLAHLEGATLPQIQGVDDPNYANNVSGTNTRIKTTQADMQSLQSDWNNAQGNSSFSQSQVTNTLKSAQDQINSTQSVLQSTQSKVNGFDASAKQIDQNAQAFAQKNGC